VITLRNIPPEVAHLIEARSRRTGLSLNRTVIQILKETLGPTETAAEPLNYTDLDDLAGAWSREEAREFDDDLARQRPIDPEQWE